ncbi:MAG: inositol monophosphatase family protein [Verrucomicrobiota bacterium]
MNPEFQYKICSRLDAIEAMLPALERDLLAMQQGDLGVQKKSNHLDLVTRADHESEQRLVRFIQENFPEDGILSEEGASHQPSKDTGSFLWVIDPVDGTVNYANRLPGWGISIGLLYADEIVGAIVSAPAYRERFRSIKGSGSSLNGNPIQVSEETQFREGLVVTGFPYDRDRRAAPLCRAMENMLKLSGGVRRLGAAALDFCAVADGRFVGYYEMALKPWDYAAGLLIAKEAGATITDFEGNPINIFTSKGVLVSNGHVHKILQEAAAPMNEAVAIE